MFWFPGTHTCRDEAHAPLEAIAKISDHLDIADVLTCPELANITPGSLPSVAGRVIGNGLGAAAHPAGAAGT